MSHTPLLPPLHPRRLPTVADVIAESPSVHSCGPLTVAWRLVAPLTLADLGPFLALAVADRLSVPRRGGDHPRSAGAAVRPRRALGKGAVDAG